MRKLTLALFFLIPSLITIFGCKKNVTSQETTYTQDIVYISDRDGNNDVFAMSFEGEGQTNLTRNTNPNSDPSFSADGKKIVFVSEIANQRDIFLMNVDGTDLVNLTDTPYWETWPIFYDNSNKILFNSDENGTWQLFSMNIDGSDRKLLTPSEDNYYYPIVSPDNQNIAYQSDCEGNRELFVMDIDGNNKIKLTETEDTEMAPIFSPDGQKIFYVLISDGLYNICSVNIDGTNFQNLTRELSSDCYLPVFTSDGKQIVFIVDKRSNMDGELIDLYIMGVNGENKRALVENAGTCWAPEVIPNSTKVIFQNDKDGDWEIYSLDLSNKYMNSLTVNSFKDVDAKIRPAF